MAMSLPIEDVISSKTSLEEVTSVLQKHGCSNLTSLTDAASCTELPVTGGGFCDLYRGKLTDGRVVAIKIPRVFERTGGMGRIQKYTAREIYQWSKLKHRNIMPLLGFTFFRSNRISMVSEWMENGDLNSFIQQNSNVDRIRLCGEVYEGLAHIHVNGMVHGDLKAANVLVSRDGVARITDFGSAWRRDATLQFSGSTTPFTLRWAAPELLRGGKVSQAADVYAYGMTVLEVLTGKPPYHPASTYQVYDLVIRGETPQQPSTAINDGLWEVLQSCWNPEPDRRLTMASIGEFMLQEAKCFPDQAPLSANTQANGVARLEIAPSSGTSKPPHTNETLCPNQIHRASVTPNPGPQSHVSPTPRIRPNDQARRSELRNKRPSSSSQRQDRGAILVGATLIGLSTLVSSSPHRKEETPSDETHRPTVPPPSHMGTLPRYVVFWPQVRPSLWLQSLNDWKHLAGARVNWGITHVRAADSSVHTTVTPIICCTLYEAPDPDVQANLQGVAASPDAAVAQARRAICMMLAAQSQDSAHGRGRKVLQKLNCEIVYQDQGAGYCLCIATPIAYTYKLEEWVAVECSDSARSLLAAREKSAQRLIESRQYCMLRS